MSKKDTDYGKYFSVDGRVNNEVGIYFKEFGWKLGYTLMDKTRMRELFVSVYNHPRLSDGYRARITTWFNDNPK